MGHRARSDGKTKWKSMAVFAGERLRGWPVGGYQVDQGAWRTKYGGAPPGNLEQDLSNSPIERPILGAVGFGGSLG